MTSSVTYWPFGYPLKTENSQAYRFGFQGKEKDNEWTGQEGSHLAFKYRIHDARIGRFLSIDPLTAKYPHNSPYAFSENSTIAFVELEGLEKVRFYTELNNYDDYEEVDVTGMSENEVKAEFKSRGFRWDKDWYDNNAEGEHWDVWHGFREFTMSSTGTKIEKYLSEDSYNGGQGEWYFYDAKRGFGEWVNAKEKSFEDDPMEAYKFMISYVGILATLGGASVAIAAEQLTVRGAAWLILNLTISVDDITGVGSEDTALEEWARNNGGQNAVNRVQNAKTVIGAFNAAKGSANVLIHYKNGETAVATWDLINNVIIDMQVVQDIKERNDKDE